MGKVAVLSSAKQSQSFVGPKASVVRCWLPSWGGWPDVSRGPGQQRTQVQCAVGSLIACSSCSKQAKRPKKVVQRIDVFKRTRQVSKSEYEYKSREEKIRKKGNESDNTSRQARPFCTFRLINQHKGKSEREGGV